HPSSCSRPLHLFFLLTRPPPTSTLFPYTTLFRSRNHQSQGRRRGGFEARCARTSTTGDSLHPFRCPVQCSEPGRGEVSLRWLRRDRKSTRLNSSHSQISYAVFCLKKKNNITRN